MMHPARQAYVEEDDPEVSKYPNASFCLGNVHASESERCVPQTGHVRLGRSRGSRLMECPELLGYGDGGGPCEYTYEKS